MYRSSFEHTNVTTNHCSCIYQDDSNPYAVPIAMGIYRRLESPLDITTSTIIRRIVANHEAYQVANVIWWLWVFYMQVCSM
jgi:hypothetical protein